MLLSLYIYFRFCFRHVQTFKFYSRAHSRIFRISSLPDIFRTQHTGRKLNVYKTFSLRPVSMRKHIQTPRYIHNTILDISIKASSQAFDTVLNASLFYRCYLTSRVTLESLLMLHFRNSGIFKTYSVIFSHVETY